MSQLIEIENIRENICSEITNISNISYNAGVNFVFECLDMKPSCFTCKYSRLENNVGYTYLAECTKEENLDNPEYWKMYNDILPEIETDLPMVLNCHEFDLKKFEKFVKEDEEYGYGIC